MKRFEPYHAADTMGIQFEVRVGGNFFCAHVADDVLACRYGPADDVSERMALFTRHRRALSQAAARRIRSEGPQIVLVRLADLG